MARVNVNNTNLIGIAKRPYEDLDFLSDMEAAVKYAIDFTNQNHDAWAKARKTTGIRLNYAFIGALLTTSIPVVGPLLGLGLFIAVAVAKSKALMVNQQKNEIYNKDLMNFQATAGAITRAVEVKGNGVNMERILQNADIVQKTMDNRINLLDKNESIAKWAPLNEKNLTDLDEDRQVIDSMGARLEAYKEDNFATGFRNPLVPNKTMPDLYEQKHWHSTWKLPKP